MNPYESNQLLDEYLLMHYGRDEELMPWSFGPADGLRFTQRTVGHFSDGSVGRALDVGCAVGGASFALSRNCEEVIGIDFSKQFIEAANRIKNDGRMAYRIHETGNSYRETSAELAPNARADQVQFLQGDAMNLPEDLGKFDRIHAANLICRLPEPVKFLERIPALLRAGGELVLATPCTWLEEFTPPRHQPPADTLEWLESILSPYLILQSQHDEPFLIRETGRKFQWSVSLVTRWVAR